MQAFSDGDPNNGALKGRKITDEMKRKARTEQIIERKKKKKGFFAFFIDPYDLALQVLLETCYEGDSQSCSTYEWVTGEYLGPII